MIGCLKHTKIRLYWIHNYKVNLCLVIVFFLLRSYFHAIDNTEIPFDNKDKFIKVRPLFLNHCKLLKVDTDLAIDEQMVKFKGKFGPKQYNILYYERQTLSMGHKKLIIQFWWHGLQYDHIHIEH